MSYWIELYMSPECKLDCDAIAGFDRISEGLYYATGANMVEAHAIIAEQISKLIGFVEMNDSFRTALIIAKGSAEKDPDETQFKFTCGDRYGHFKIRKSTGRDAKDILLMVVDLLESIDIEVAIHDIVVRR
jgi:hypothetical protein